MNRSQRRAILAREKSDAAAAPKDVATMFAEANHAFHEGRSAVAEAICRRILARAPAHTAGLNLLGLIYQASGRHRLAIRMFAKALAVAELDAAVHYNIASSYQILERRADATAHFERAIALGLSGKNIEHFVLQNAHVVEGVQRAMAGPTPGSAQGGPSLAQIAKIADDIFLQCALRLRLIRGAPLETFFTRLRSMLLAIASADADGSSSPTGADLTAFFCALAQQCFINEYVFSHDDGELRQASRLRDLLQEKLSTGGEVAPILLAAVAAYFPLHLLPESRLLLAADWLDYAVGLVRQQVGEPLGEAEDRPAIPALTQIDDPVSIAVMRQYEENPYPRWTLHPLVAGRGAFDRQQGDSEPNSAAEILIAGCGTGKHVFDVVQQWPRARILAIDISRPSLAYARRKTREAGLRGIEYAQADILKLAALGRTFDRIEAVGVLHHLKDPRAAWRVLLSLLEPEGVLRVGLYSDAARQAIVEARAVAAARGLLPTAAGIRALRQTIIRDDSEPRWQALLDIDDFYSMSGCRDMFFHVMEHRFTIPQIAAFLDEDRLSFLGFDLPPATMEKFAAQFAGKDDLTNLEHWHAFETANPLTFRHMYVLSVRRQ